MPPNTNPLPPTPTSTPTPTLENNSQVESFNQPSQTNPSPISSGQPFNVQSVVNPSQQQKNKAGTLLILAGAILALIVAAALIYFAIVAPGLNNAQQDNSASNDVQTSQQNPVTGSVIGMADKATITADTVKTGCYTADFVKGMDLLKTQQSSVSGCMVAMSPADVKDMSTYLSYNIVPHTSSESYEAAVERITTDGNIGASSITKTTVDGAEAIVFNTLKGTTAGRQYVIKAPVGKFELESKPQNQKITAFFIIGIYSSSNTAAAKSVDALAKSFKFAD